MWATRCTGPRVLDTLVAKCRLQNLVWNQNPSLWDDIVALHVLVTVATHVLQQAGEQQEADDDATSFSALKHKVRGVYAHAW